MPPSPASMVPNPAAAIPGLVLGAAQTVAGLINNDKAKKEAKELSRTRPKREISPLFDENLALSESELAGGMSTAAEKAYTNQLDKSTAASLSAILRGGGDVNSVSDVFAAGEEGRQRLAMLTDQLRLSQINNVVKARETMAGEQDKNFIFNDWMPYADKAQANADARKSATEGIWSGLSTLTGGAMGMLSNSGGSGGSGGADVSGVNRNALSMAGRPASSLPDLSSMNQVLAQPTPGFNPLHGPYVMPITDSTNYLNLY